MELIPLAILALIALIGGIVSIRSQRKAMASIAPGVYIFQNEVDNPFRTEYDYVRVHEVKDGWVKYTFTPSNDPNGPARSKKLSAFAEIYVRYPFEEE